MLTGAIALKEDDIQFISTQTGDVLLDDTGFGLYYHDTRYLSRFELTMNGTKPIFLSNAANKHYIATFQYINPDLLLEDGRRVRQQTISIRRSRFVTGRGLYERIGFLNCNHFPVELSIVLAFDADFQDMFAVRGFTTQHVAGQITIAFGEGNLSLSYRGRDSIRRSTVVMFDPPADAISSRSVRFCLRLQPQQFDTVVVRVQPTMGKVGRRLNPNFDGELEKLATSYRRWDRVATRIATNNEQFDNVPLRASRYDIRALLEDTRYGLVPDAGVPWYAVPFGRDAIITALQTLMYNPEIAEGTLRFLAANQGTTVDQYKEEEPGKIMHELRRGELARLGQVPHSPYYGTVDATPLFLVLLAETMAWCDSAELYRDLLPAALKALEWIDEYGDLDGDGYVEYITHRPGGVLNQGWKDSSDSVQHADGRNADAPIALVEVQGYVYQAKIGMARLLRANGNAELAGKLERSARDLRERFNRDFWMDDLGYYAIALDREKKQVRSVTSNPGHCLWSGICDPEKADLVARRLLAPDMFSGWGIRTLSEASPNYNPMSYHNGSVWPHDTALIALGLRRAGFGDAAVTVATGLVQAALRFEDNRLPELFCGFARDRRFNSSPTAYIVSCSPQAWAAGCICMVLQTMLGLRPETSKGELHVDPLLPDIFHRVSLEHMRLGGARYHLTVEGSGADVAVELSGGEQVQLRHVSAA